MNFILLIGAILGLLSVIIAAYVDHYLGLHLTGKSLNGMLTALRYHQLYAIVICIIGLSLPGQVSDRIKFWLTTSAYTFSLGILLFSFSIYLSSIFHIRGIVYLTPVGGVLLMTGWALLIRSALWKMK
ncbi:MAG: DUF423 domain-containing protein [Gammaproteobacteria bacterium]|nr:DUF423 domain-containing protein [Gammaproteobacteria bacterium]